MRFRYFRAFIGAAPLKLNTRPFHQPRVANFRAFIGAAPLKPPGTSAVNRDAHEFPRLHRRGSIEAANGSPRAISSTDFRAFIGAAPLKRFQGRTVAFLHQISAPSSARLH